MKNEPTWLNTIFNAFLKSIMWTSVDTPIHKIFNYKCKEVDGIWEIIISPWLHEIYGGAKDGSLSLPSYEMNLIYLIEKFNKVEYIGFDSDKVEANIKGEIENSLVNLTFRKFAPQSKARNKINVFTGEVTKIETFTDF